MHLPKISYIKRTVLATVTVGLIAVIALGALLYSKRATIAAMDLASWGAFLAGAAGVFAVILVSAGYLVPQMYVLGANAILNIVLTIVLAKLWGVEGAVWAIPVSTLLTSAWAYPLMIARGIRHKAAERAASPSATDAGAGVSAAASTAAAAAAASPREDGTLS